MPYLTRARLLASIAIATVLASCALAAHATVGMAELPASGISGIVTVFYPATAAERLEQRGGFELGVAVDAAPVQGNRRLVVISHGSPASPWVYTDLARALVDAGYVVAMPEHQADNYKDSSEPGPPSWRRRPLEVSRAIDRMAAEPRFAPLLDLNKVGMYGMSAGGHTALVLAGGRWSPSRLREHCEAHLAEDFQACVGLATSLTGGMLDGVKMAITRQVIAFKLDDPAWYQHTDPRIAAVISGVPAAAQFDPASLRSPVVPLGIIRAQQDKWFLPRYHSDAILNACAGCERVADLPTGGHGSLLGPLPPRRGGLVDALVQDPPGFDRTAVVPDVNRRIAAFFGRHLR